MWSKLTLLKGEELCNEIANVCEYVNTTYDGNVNAIRCVYDSDLEKLKEQRWTSLSAFIPSYLITRFGITRETGKPKDELVANYISRCYDGVYNKLDSIVTIRENTSSPSDSDTAATLSSIGDVKQGRSIPAKVLPLCSIQDHFEDETGRPNTKEGYEEGWNMKDPFEEEKYQVTQDDEQDIIIRDENSPNHREKRPYDETTYNDMTESSPKVRFRESTTDNVTLGRYDINITVNPTTNYCRTLPPGAPKDSFYCLGTTQFIEGGNNACTTISCVAMYYFQHKTSEDDIVNNTSWEKIMQHGTAMYDIWKKNEGATRIDCHTSLDDIMNMENMSPIFEDMGEIKVNNGPLYYEQTLDYTDEDRGEWVPLINMLKQFRDIPKSEDGESMRVGVLTINGYTISLWTTPEVTMLFDSHGSGAFIRKATVDFIHSITTVYKRCLSLTKCELYWKGEGGSMMSDQYTFYHTV